jgi:hypothetical protein
MQRGPSRWQFLFADHVARHLVGEDQGLLLQLAPSRQIAQDGQKRRDAGAAGDEHAGALVADGAEWFRHQQFGAGFQLMQQPGYAVGMVRIALDGEFQHPVVGQPGGRERPALFAQAGC